MASLGETAIGSLMQGYEFGQRINDRQRQRERQDKLDQRQDELFQMNREQHAANMDAMQYKFSRQKAQDALAPIIYGLKNNQPISVDVLRNANEATGGKLLQAWSNVATPRQQQAAQFLEGMMNPQSGIGLNDPRGIAAANLVLQPELLEGVGQKTKVNGKAVTIKRKFVNGFTPSPNGKGIMVDLGIIGTDEAGNEVKYSAPATKGRGTQADALVADIPLDKAIQKIQGLNGMSRLLQSNPQLQDAMNQLAVSYGVKVDDDKPVTLKEIKRGDQIETYAVSHDGKFTKIASAPRFKPDSKGSGSNSASYSRIDSILKKMFATQLDVNGNAVFGSDESKDDYLEAMKLASGYIDDGMNPGEAAYRAYRATANYTIPDAAQSRIDDRVDAQIKQMEQSGKGVKAKTFLGVEYGKTYGGYDQDGAKNELRLAYEDYYKKHGKLPQGFIAAPWADQGTPNTGLAAAADGTVPNAESDVVEKAKSQYPILQKYGLVGVKSKGSKDGNMLEFWPPDEPGDNSSPRPTAIPMDKIGVQILKDDTSPKDVLADVTSHYLIHKDPVISKSYKRFVNSLTQEQKDRLREDYKWAKEHENEKRPFNEWVNKVRLPAYFRGYTFDQWPRSFTKKVFTPGQIEIFDGVRKYLGVDEGVSSDGKSIPENPSAGRGGLAAAAAGAPAQPAPNQAGLAAAQPAPPPVTPAPVDSAQLARSAVAKAAQGQPLSPQEKQAVIEQANQAIAAGKDPNSIRARLEKMGIQVTAQGAN